MESNHEHNFTWITGRMQVKCENEHWHEVEKGYDFEACSCGIYRGQKKFKCDEITVKIRATHPYGFRSGIWAQVIGIEWKNNRICYIVQFHDGKLDFWPIYDPSDPYEFKT